ncbi:MAG: hypothetical protein KDA05_10780 [Phycisphaerales bacterium]|nr:hypothetical protein [Phycisphaerales bacterium]MCB9840051.1 hypothetical protein [Phycisphaeraceae bacterium]
MAPTAAEGLLPLQLVHTGESASTRSAQIDYFKYAFRPTEQGQMYPE